MYSGKNIYTTPFGWKFLTVGVLLLLVASKKLQTFFHRFSNNEINGKVGSKLKLLMTNRRPHPLYIYSRDTLL